MPGNNLYPGLSLRRGFLSGIDFAGFIFIPPDNVCTSFTGAILCDT